jgi:hypothetical protein
VDCAHKHFILDVVSQISASEKCHGYIVVPWVYCNTLGSQAEVPVAVVPVALQCSVLYDPTGKKTTGF